MGASVMQRLLDAAGWDAGSLRHKQLEDAMAGAGLALVDRAVEPAQCARVWHRKDCPFCGSPDGQYSANTKDIDAAFYCKGCGINAPARTPAGKECQGGLIEDLRHHERDYPTLVHGPLCGLAADEIERLLGLVESARKVIEPFAMLCRLDTKPEQSALDSVYPMVAVGRLRDALEYIDGRSNPSTVRTPEREYEPGMNPSDDAEFGMKP